MRNNLVSENGKTVHLPVNTFEQNRYACQPRVGLVRHLEEKRTDDAVTCGNCLRVIARAEALAHAWRDAILAGAAEAEKHHAADVKAFERGERDRMPFYLGRISRARTLELRRSRVAYWFNRGDVDAMNGAGWALRRMELEQEYREQLAAEAELEAHAERVARIEFDRACRVQDTLETIVTGLAKAGRADTVTSAQRWAAMLDLEHGYAQQLAWADDVQLITVGEWQQRMEHVARGRAEAVTGATNGERVGHPVDDPNWLRCSLSFGSVTDRLAGKRARVTDLLSVPSPLGATDLWELGMAAFDVQRNLDIIHARVIGQCPGCWRDRETQAWGHRPMCPNYLRTEPMTAEEIKQYWSPADAVPANCV
jgi:hypothetical protein